MERATRFASSAATRYLCVGAELDEVFARQVLGELLAEHRVVAPSYGIDVVPVVLHALKAERRRMLRDMALCALVLTELVLAPIPAVAVLLVTSWTAWARRSAGGTGRAMSLIIGIALLAFSAAAWLQYQDLLLLGPAADLLRVGGMDRLDRFLVSLPVVVLLAGLVRYTEWHVGRALVGRQLRADRFDPGAVRVPLSDRLRRRLAVIDHQQYGGVTVYRSDAEDPFVGAGIVMDGTWSIALDLHPKRDLLNEGAGKMRWFTPAELHRDLGQRLAGLGDAGLGQPYRLPSLELSDEVFVDGLTSWDGLPAHVRLVRSPARVKEQERIANVPTGPLRHFKCVRVESWGGELVMTVFVHLATQGRTLFVEFTPCLLPPIRPEYHVVDIWPVPTAEERGAAIREAWGGSVGALVAAPARLVESWRLGSEPGRRERTLRRALSRGHVVDRGAVTSVRQLGARPLPDHYFQRLDARKYLNVIQVQLFNAITDFLDAHSIDTSELRERQTAILNKSVTIQGLTIQGDNTVIGSDNRLTVGRGAAGAASSRSPSPAGAGAPAAS